MVLVKWPYTPLGSLVKYVLSRVTKQLSEPGKDSQAYPHTSFVSLDNAGYSLISVLIIYFE